MKRYLYPVTFVFLTSIALGTACNDAGLKSGDKNKTEDDGKDGEDADGGGGNTVKVDCTDKTAVECKEAVEEALGPDPKTGPNVEVMGCKEDDDDTCAKIDKLGDTPEQVTLVDPNGGSDTGDSDAGTDAGPGDGYDSGFLEGDGSADSDTDYGGPAGGLIVDADEGDSKVPKFGLLVNDLKCGLCHVKVTGDVASTSSVGVLWGGSVAEITGGWYIAGTFDGTKQPTPNPNNEGISVEIKVSRGVNENQTTKSTILPKDLNGDGKPDFPTLDFAGIESKMTGRVTAAGGIDFKKVHEGNLVLDGSSEPIHAVGEVLVKGDLVIKGKYKGIGNIYVTGNIYIPANLTAEHSPFPYPANRNDAVKRAVQSLKDREDALALATPNSIIVGDFEDHGTGGGGNSVFKHDFTPPADRYEALGLGNVYQWYPNGATGFNALYVPGNLGCKRPRAEGQLPEIDNGRSFSRIDAFLYAQKAVGGRAQFDSYAINGGVIADHFHIISAASACPAGTHPVHGQDQQFSHVNYDWRMKSGLLLLKQFSRYFGN
jgi:hypothetical protein